MDIGKEKKEITFEPVEAPAEQPVTPEPVPAEPAPEPVPEPSTEPVPVGSGCSTVPASDGATVKEPVGV